MDFKTAINNIRHAIYGIDVRESLAAMGEYLEEYFHECASKIGDAIQSADDAAESAANAETAAENASRSASMAATYEQNAGTKASAAASSASAAKASEEAAEAAAKKAGAMVSTDTSLSISGAAADAKATGDALSGKLASGSAGYIKSVSVSGNRMTITYGDGSTKSVTLAESYTLPSATASSLGGIKVGSNLSITSAGVLSAIDGASIVAQSIGETDSYIRLSNGIQICWGFASYKYVTFLAPFVDDNSVGFASHLSSSNTKSLVNSTKSTLSANFLDWVAVGLWK